MVLERLVIYRRPYALDKLAAAALLPWAERPRMVFEN